MKRFFLTIFVLSVVYVCSAFSQTTTITYIVIYGKGGSVYDSDGKLVKICPDPDDQICSQIKKEKKATMSEDEETIVIGHGRVITRNISIMAGEHANIGGKGYELRINLIPRNGN